MRFHRTQRVRLENTHANSKRMFACLRHLISPPLNLWARKVFRCAQIACNCWFEWVYMILVNRPCQSIECFYFRCHFGWEHTRCVWYYISFYRHWFARLLHSLRIKGVHIWTLPFESRMRFKKLATLKSQETLFRCFASSMERGGLLFTRREWKRWVINSNDGNFY